MNRNLKRVLSVALMIAVLAVNFVIPASAATTITVSYTDLLNYSLAGGQGTLFYDTNPGTGATGSGLENPATSWNRNYAPLEVWNAANRASLRMTASEWVRFEVEAEEAGYYAVGMEYGCGVAAGAEFFIRTDSQIVETVLPKSGQNAYSWNTVNNLGYLYLNAGTNYVYVDNKDHAALVNFKQITFTKATTADSTMVTTLKQATSCSESATLTPTSDYGYDIINVDGETVTFPITVERDGKYQVYFRGKTENGSSATVSNGISQKELTLAKTEITIQNNDGTTTTKNIYKNSETATFALTAGAHNITVTGLENYNLAWVCVKYVAPYQTIVVSESISNGATVTRGTDSMVIEFNDTMEDVSEGQVTLEDATGEMATVTEADGEKIIVSFLETLDYDSTYTLTLTGIKSVNDLEPLADMTYTFFTYDTDYDNGEASVANIDVTTEYEAITVTGNVFGSTDKGIKGRNVSIADPDGNEVATTVSGDNGLFTLEFTIPAGTNAGNYTYAITTEYGTATDTIVPYVSLAEEARILGLFQTATTPAAVATIFQENFEVLRVPNYATDIEGLADTDLFHNHFMQKTFARVENLAPFYQRALLLEKMNQSTTGSYIYSNFINQPAVCELLGFDMNKMALLGAGANEKTALANRIATYTSNNGPAQSEQDFLTRVGNLLDQYLLELNGINTTTLVISNPITSAYLAGEISLPVSFAAPQSKISKIAVNVTSDNPAILANAEIIAEGATETNISLDGNTTTLELVYEYDPATSYTSIGRVSLQASQLGLYNLTVDALVTYRIQKTVTETDAEGHQISVVKSTDFEIPVAGSNLAVSVLAGVAETVRPTTGTGGGFVAPPKPVEKEEEDTNKSQYFFDDMGSALWAQDMVHTLVGKGVISANEQRAFRPMDNVTREEAVKMIIAAIGSHNPDAVATLKDVPADHWASSYIATAQELGIVQGNSNGNFALGTNITRQDMTVMIYRTFVMLGMDLSVPQVTFQDGAEIASYAQDAVGAMTKLGVINGMGDNTFAPGAYATRAQLAKVIYVMMEVLGV